MEKIKESWLIAPISGNDSFKEVVIRRDGLLKKTREYCRSNREIIGFIYGYPYEENLLLVGMNIYGVGSEISSELDPFYLERHNECLNRARMAYPSLTTILFHSHPRLEPIKFPEQTLQLLREDLRSGIFDYLKDYGLKPTLDLVLAEFSRTLSQDDLENTVGKITILLTDTRWPQDEFSHLNVYEILGRDMASVNRLRVAALEDKPTEISLVFNKVSDYLDVLQKELKQKWGHSIK